MNNFCVCCGAEIPEGRQICYQCEHQYEEGEDNDNARDH